MTNWIRERNTQMLPKNIPIIADSTRIWQRVLVNIMRCSFSFSSGQNTFLQWHVAVSFD
jgi:hypothetical protein